jgi:hypothetical protein
LEQLNDVLLDGVSGTPVLLVVASSCSPEKFYTLLDHVLWYDGSRTTSLRQQGDRTVSSPSDLQIAAGDSLDIRDLHDLSDLLDLPDQLC